MNRIWHHVGGFAISDGVQNITGIFFLGRDGLFIHMDTARQHGLVLSAIDRRESGPQYRERKGMNCNGFMPAQWQDKANSNDNND